MTEIIGWMQIMISPSLIGLVIGFLVYYNIPNTIGFIICCSIALLGIFIGVKLATKKFKTSGTVDFVSRVHASPELDDISDIHNK
ncbi:hypothetical protein ACSVH2_02675 [Flavobacterium sp. RSB2_4_14]|uniref:hypothetical protein n=1 Tax=Flavobacterium sp. RSB2_4_14 TaxID=3447665 RepID=UPI003F34EAED